MARSVQKRDGYNAARRKTAVAPDEWTRRLVRDQKSRSQNPNKASWYRKADLKRRYGITPAAWDKMFKAQGFVCAVCKSSTPKRKTGHWSTDHDHKTGTVRGILCSGCNTALGHAGDDPNRLRMLAEYLETGGGSCLH